MVVAYFKVLCQYKIYRIVVAIGLGFNIGRNKSFSDLSFSVGFLSPSKQISRHSRLGHCRFFRYTFSIRQISSHSTFIIHLSLYLAGQIQQCLKHKKNK